MRSLADVEPISQGVRWRLGLPTDVAHETGALLWDQYRGQPESWTEATSMAFNLAQLLRNAIGARLGVFPADPANGEILDSLRSEFGRWVTEFPAASTLVARKIRFALLRSNSGGAERKLKAVRWKLGIPADDDPTASDDWHRLVFQGDRPFFHRLADVADALGLQLENALRLRFGLTLASGVPDHDQLVLDSLVSAFSAWVALRPAHSILVAGIMRRSLGVHPPRGSNGMPRPHAAPRIVRSVGEGDDDRRMPECSQPRNGPPPPTPQGPVAGPPAACPASSADAPGDAPARPSAMWRVLAVEDRMDRHDDTFTATLEVPGAYRMVGSRARGRKHRHDGTNCDDWFELARSGDWAIVAVSDGAGSKRLSRVGAKVSCRAAAASLAGSLATLPVPGPETVAQALLGAVISARRALDQALLERISNPEYAGRFGGLQPADFAATLLLAVMRRLPGSAGGSFCMTVQIGDGALAAVAGDRVISLGVPEAGEFAGETQFLASAGEPDMDWLRRRAHEHVGHFDAVLVMTDGVADDFFPADPGFRHLADELALCGAFPRLGRGAPAVAGPQAPAGEPQRRLLEWLDGYYRRGSFDDRTLVVVTEEDTAA
ncbi:MAG: protein phosphatase 2C domain-containing protein [Candidatus Sericytochromatia bacterium]|nr:protein phosphatase 2C domain-containing protein [Candidatus Tanganyikabacteria bacterium]